MIGFIGISIIGFILLALFISVIYFCIYQYSINKQLQTGTKKKTLPTPLNVCITVLIVTLLTIVIISTGLIVYQNVNHTSYDKAYTNFNSAKTVYSDCYTSDDISDTYAALYEEKNELPGYTKYQKTDGAFLYTYYISNTDYDILHPKCIVFLEYSGTDNYDLYAIDSGFAYNDGFADYSGNFDYSAPEYWCFLANADGNCSFEIYVGTFQKSIYEEKAMELEQSSEMHPISEQYSVAISSSSIQIDLHYPGENTLANSYGVEDISLDDIYIGDFIDDIDLSSYIKSDRYSGNYRYKFDNLVIDTDKDDAITYLFAPIGEGVKLIIGAENDITTIEEIQYLLGDDYKISTYDYEQMLKSCTYYNASNNVQVSFIYTEFDDSTSNNNHQLCFVKMEQQYCP